MIAASPSVGYIHEPFNLEYRVNLCTAPFSYWFTYVTEENEAAFYEPLKDILAFRCNLAAKLPTVQTVRQMGSLLKQYQAFTRYRHRQAIPLMKDPLALFSAEWLASRFDMDVIVLIRHPAAFASSVRRLNWRHDFSHFLRQPLLMRDHLAPFEAEITEFATQEHDILDQAILLWKITHSVILKYQATHKDWIFLRHEDISEDPLHYFAYLFKTLNLDFSEQVQAVIEDYTNPSNPTDAQNGHAFTRRNSKSLVRSWKKGLTEAELTYIRKGVEMVSKQFYSESEW
jgi:hypothetical protein